ncbi:carbohydrate porin [Brenneria tiliae]|uniref:Carbohydrate porin n=1 Tax=Brenneria tiliae TaxID=2914984 RepID=A0ABT0MX21_9GAMM|nr:carbohydrate porin [Brenneria tiliae]MCL2894390.1 carbohydrate porin [Brenneria tiliae]
MDNPYLAKGWYREPEPGLGELLNDKGIVYRGLMLNALFNNISTGARVGHTGGQTIFINALDLDLAKLANMANSRIHIEGVIFPWHHPGDEDGNMVEFGSYASSYLGGDQYPSHDASFSPWLSLLTYEISLLEGRLDVEFGKTNLQRYYFSPNCGIDFLCTDALVKWNTGVPDASTGSMGGRVGYKLSRAVTAEAGIQQMREYSSLIKDNGWDAFGMGGGTGTFAVASLRYKTDFSYHPYPEDYQFNYFYADARIRDPYETDKSHRGSGGIVVKFAKTFWSETGKTAATGTDIPSNLGYFGTIEHSFDDAKPVDWGLTLGMAYVKPQIALPHWIELDQITGKVMYIHLNKSTLLAQRDTRMSLGGSDQMTSSNEYRIELSSTFSIGTQVKIQPAIEYIVNPDSAISRTSANVPVSGWLVGVTVALMLGNP